MPGNISAHAYSVAKSWAQGKDSSKLVVEGSGGKKKRKKNKKTSENGDSIAAVTNFRMIDRYRSIYYATSLGNHEMLVVERPWLHVLRSLPDPIYRKKYGKT